MTGADAAFGSYASHYDESFTNTVLGRKLRNRVWRYLARSIKPDQQKSVLEINCGTGEDAVWLAARGFTVTATDQSPEMIEVVRQKAAARNLPVHTKASGFESLEQHFQPGSFDLIFSDFGGLNCVDGDTLEALSKSFARLLKPGGRLIVVVMGRDCPWEKWYFRRKQKPGETRRRQRKDGVPVRIDGKDFFTWYYSSSEFAAKMANHFTLLRKRPVGWVLPPSYLEPYFRKHPLLLGLLDRTERFFGGSIFADKADHFLADFQRKEEASVAQQS